MYVFIEIIKSFVLVFLSALEIAMLIRAVLSWFVMGDGGKFVNFLYAITEPFIAPVRAFLVKMNWLQNSPIDFSFLLTYLIISVLSMILTVV